MGMFLFGWLRGVVRTTVLVGLLLAVSATAQTQDLGNGFLHHGVATPISNHRGTVATVDGEGRNVVLVWLFDHRGGYGLLVIDAETGKSETFPLPFPVGDAPYASILSSANRFYTHFNNHFVEFDPAERAFTFHRQTTPRMAMSMTEDDNGVIWSATYPQSGIVSFDPRTRAFRDYGHVHKENWQQYPRALAADDAGWIYFGIGSTATQIFALEPESGKVEAMTPDSQRVQGSCELIRDMNGKVYGRPGGENEKLWYEFYKGRASQVGAKPEIQPKPIITGPQTLFHREFPDGRRVRSCDLVTSKLTVENPATGDVKTVRFDYASEGAHLMGLATAPDGTICGGTAFPMRFFSYDPRTDTWTNRACYGQWNTVARHGDRFFVGGYPRGYLLEWDPAREWVPTQKDDEQSNPLFLTEITPTIHRPHDLLVWPDGKTIILAGTPGYGYTGGGLLFWDRSSGTQVVLEHSDILPDHSTMSLLALPDGKLLGGTTTSPGSGGEKKATLAELYLMDLATKKLEWHAPLLPGVQDYSDLCAGPRGLVYGVADLHWFFVFDPAERRLIHKEDLEASVGRTNWQQGPRIFVRDAKDNVCMLLAKGIARVEPETFAIRLLAESPVPVHAGGDYYDGRIYFSSGSHLYSYTLPKASSAPGGPK